MAEDPELHPPADEATPLLPPATPAPAGGIRARVPGPVATVVDRVMDAADEVAEELKRALDRMR